VVAPDVAAAAPVSREGSASGRNTSVNSPILTAWMGQ
jgi:hypothetical protein